MISSQTCWPLDQRGDIYKQLNTSSIYFFLSEFLIAKFSINWYNYFKLNRRKRGRVTHLPRSGVQVTKQSTGRQGLRGTRWSYILIVLHIACSVNIDSGHGGPLGTCALVGSKTYSSLINPWGSILFLYGTKWHSGSNTEWGRTAESIRTNPQWARIWEPGRRRGKMRVKK